MATPLVMPQITPSPPKHKNWVLELCYLIPGNTLDRIQTSFPACADLAVRLAFGRQKIRRTLC
jgi:hypothetical protein